jgi:hypothetical protein
VWGAFQKAACLSCQAIEAAWNELTVLFVFGFYCRRFEGPAGAAISLVIWQKLLIFARLAPIPYFVSSYLRNKWLVCSQFVFSG